MDISLLTFSLMAVVVVMTPGPTVLLALSNGSRFGFTAAGYGIAGAAISDAVLIAAAGVGLGAVLATSGFVFNVVKWVGVAYLIWLGVQMLRTSGELHLRDHPAGDQNPDKPRPYPAIFRKSFLVAVTNPKGLLFFTAFLPQFLIPEEPMLMQYVTLAIVFIAIDVAVMAAYATLGARAMTFLSARGALWIDRVCGGFLVTLGLGLAFLRRSAA